MTTQHARILEQYSTPGGRTLYRHVMGDGTDHIHYGIYDGPEVGMREALTASCRALWEWERGDGVAPQEILDLGAGAGGPAKCLLNWSDARVTCVDIGAPALLDLENWGQAKGLSHRLQTWCGSFLELPTDWTRRFDLVWSQDALCHASDRAAVFAEAKRVLRPGGSLVFSDILLAENAPQEQARAFTNVNAVQNLGTPMQYDRALRQAGFATVAVQDWTGHLATNFRRMRAQIDSLRTVLLEEGAQPEALDRFAVALDARLGWPEGRILKWLAFRCRT